MLRMKQMRTPSPHLRPPSLPLQGTPSLPLQGTPSPFFTETSDANSKPASSRLQSQRGLAVLEMIPLLIVLMLMLNFSFGFFGAIHSGILGSMAARNYAFETFRNRADLTYFHNQRLGASTDHYKNNGFRFHGSVSEGVSSGRLSGDVWYVTLRNIDFLQQMQEQRDDRPNDRIESAIKDTERNEDRSVNPIWVKPIYGICLDSSCGDR